MYNIQDALVEFKAIYEGNEQIAKSTVNIAKPAADLSRFVNTREYYRKRHEDYMSRNPLEKDSPYYIEYGEKYMNRFLDETDKKFRSDFGHYWIKQTSKLLQQYLEAELHKNPYLEQNRDKFIEIAYETHYPAYINAGLEKFFPEHIEELIALAQTADLEDSILDARGFKLMLKALYHVCINPAVHLNRVMAGIDYVKRNAIQQQMKIINELLKKHIGYI